MSSAIVLSRWRHFSVKWGGGFENFKGKRVGKIVRT